MKMTWRSIIFSDNLKKLKQNFLENKGKSKSQTTGYGGMWHGCYRAGAELGLVTQNKRSQELTLCSLCK